MTNTPRPERWVNLGQRVLSALVMGLVYIFPFYFGGGVWVLAVGSLVALCLYEWQCVFVQDTVNPSLILSVVGVFIFLFLIHWEALSVPMVTLSVAMVILLVTMGLIGFIQWTRNRPVVWTVTGLLYLSLCGAIAVALRGTVSGFFAPGFEQLIFIIFTVIAVDAGAYFGGSYFKGALLAPAVSPNKTWAGCICGLLSALMIALLYGYFIDLPFVTIVWMALCIGVLSVLGDLLESFFKRSFRIKDTGSLLPGHGGVLDRLDSLILTLLIFGGALWLFPWLWPAV